MSAELIQVITSAAVVLIGAALPVVVLLLKLDYAKIKAQLDAQDAATTARHIALATPPVAPTKPPEEVPCPSPPLPPGT